MKKFVDIVMIVSFILLWLSVVVFYQTVTGRILVISLCVISLISYEISEYLESKEES